MASGYDSQLAKLRIDELDLRIEPDGLLHGYHHLGSKNIDEKIMRTR